MAETTALPTSALRHGPQTYSGFGRWSRQPPSDEDSGALRASIGRLSEQIEAAIAARRAGRGAAVVQACAQLLAQGLAEHQRFLTGMGSDWHALYEFAAYQRALRELRALLARWQQRLVQRERSEAQCFRAFETLAWRTLGEGALLIDMYERGESSQGAALESTRPTRGRRPGSWRARLRAWWAGRGRGHGL